MRISETGRNVLGILVVILSVIMTLLGLCVIGLAAFLKIDLEKWKGLGLMDNYKSEILFKFLLPVGCTLFVLHLICAKCTLTVSSAEQRESCDIPLLPIIVLLFLMILALIVAGVLCTIHRGLIVAAFQKGLVSRMKMYKSNLKVKALLDQLQIEYECCGSRSYADWFELSFINNEFINTGYSSVQRKLQYGEYITDDAPFSCCDVKCSRPCIFHKVLQEDAHKDYTDVTLYKRGCSRVFTDFYYKVLTPAFAVFYVAAGVEWVIVFLLRHLQTSISSADRNGDPSGIGESHCCRASANEDRESTAPETSDSTSENARLPPTVEFLNTGGKIIIFGKETSKTPKKTVKKGGKKKKAGKKKKRR